MVNNKNNYFNSNLVPGGGEKQTVPALSVDTLRAGRTETLNTNVVGKDESALCISEGIHPPESNAEMNKLCKNTKYEHRNKLYMSFTEKKHSCFLFI